eukprot:939040_1
MHPKVKKRSRKRIESDERRPDSSCLVIKKRKLIKNDYPVVPVHINIAYQSIYLMLYSNMRKCGHIKRHFCFDDGIKLIAEYAMWRRQRCQGIGPSPRCKAFKDIFIEHQMPHSNHRSHEYRCKDCNDLTCVECKSAPSSDRKRDRFTRCHGCEISICANCSDLAMRSTWLWDTTALNEDEVCCCDKHDLPCKYGDCRYYGSLVEMRKEQRKKGLVFCNECNHEAEFAWC